MIHGKLMLNGADYAPLNLYGVGVFMAFSGRGNYRNKGSCGAIAGDGPLPLGKYWVVDRREGNWFTQKEVEAKDAINRMIGRYEYGRSDWFALWRDDWGIDDWTWIEGVKRGNFRLHPGTFSEGCITIAHPSDFGLIRNAFMKNPPFQLPCTRSLMARGYIEVVSNGYSNTCP
jgi:Protein of unknown function (DUF2778)